MLRPVCQNKLLYVKKKEVNLFLDNYIVKFYQSYKKKVRN